jgi:hypothetical protein
MKALILLVVALLLLTVSGAQDINRIEYYFDNDPGFGNGIPVAITPGAKVSANFTADITGLTHGMHLLCLRAMNSDSIWSVLSWLPFAAFDYSSFPDIVTMEYFFDTDPGFGLANSITITPFKRISATFAADVTGIPPGMHLLCIRAKNSVGNWSIVTVYPFLVYNPDIADIQKLEYFFDTDPGYGNGKNIPITPGTRVSATFVPDLTGIPPGIHLLLVRAKNNHRDWSILQKAIFNLDAATPHSISQLEYYYNDDPGFGNGRQVTITPAILLSSAFQADTAGVPPGEYTLVARVKNDENRWSIIQTQPITIKLKTWNGLVDDDWTNDGNWTPAGIPGSGDDVTIPATAPVMPAVRNQGFGCHNLRLKPNATVTIDPLMILTIRGNVIIE